MRPLIESGKACKPQATYQVPAALGEWRCIMNPREQAAQFLRHCSPFYFSRKNCAEAIKALYPDARIIITLRHPTDYFYSLFCIDLRNCQAANCPILTDAVNKKIIRQDNDGAHLWVKHIQNWLSLFGKNQVKILILEEWRERPEQTAQECYRFIGVDHSFLPWCQWLNSALAQGVKAPANLHELQRKRLNVSGQDRQFYPVNYLARRHSVSYTHLTLPTILLV